MNKKKLLLLFILVLVVLPACFADFTLDLFDIKQRIMSNVEWQPFGLQYFTVGLGWGMPLFSDLHYDNFISTGMITPHPQDWFSIDENVELFFSLRSNLYRSFLKSGVMSLQAGISGSAGWFSVPDLETISLGVSGLLGVCFLPKSPLAVTLVMYPGYTFLPNNFSYSGFTLPISISGSVSFRGVFIPAVLLLLSVVILGGIAMAGGPS